MIPAPYPDAADSRECVHGTHVSEVLILGIPLRIRASAVAGPRGPASAGGACQAPHTTAIRWAPPLITFRSVWRMYASRLLVGSSSSTVSRSAVMASVIASNESGART